MSSKTTATTEALYSLLAARTSVTSQLIDELRHKVDDMTARRPMRYGHVLRRIEEIEWVLNDLLGHPVD